MDIDVVHRRDRLRVVARCVCIWAALAASAHGNPVPVGTGPAVNALRYVVQPNVLELVDVTASDAGLTLDAQQVRKQDGARLGGVLNERLFPARDPLNQASARLVRLDAEVSGFVVAVDYIFPDGIERFTLGFRETTCASAARPVSADIALPIACSWPLRYYRRERLDLQGQLVSGIVADYDAGRARWLQGPAYPLRPPMPTVPLRSVQQPTLQDMGSIFDFSPALDVPVRY